MTPRKYNNGKVVGWRSFGEINQIHRSEKIRPPLEQIPEKSQERSAVMSSMKELSSPVKSKSSMIRKNSTTTPGMRRATNSNPSQSKTRKAVA
jgi:hypothetical protein